MKNGGKRQFRALEWDLFDIKQRRKLDFSLFL